MRATRSFTSRAYGRRFDSCCGFCAILARSSVDAGAGRLALRRPGEGLWRLILEAKMFDAPFKAVIVAFAALVAAACSGRYVRSEPIPPSVRLVSDARITRNVVVVSIDGLRPDAIG